MTAEVLVSLLRGQTSAGDRVHPIALPQGAKNPVISFLQMGSIPTHAMGGDVPIDTIRVQVDCWGDNYLQARTLASEVASTLSRFRGLVGADEVLDIVMDDELDDLDAETGNRRVIQSYTIFVR